MPSAIGGLLKIVMTLYQPGSGGAVDSTEPHRPSS